MPHIDCKTRQTSLESSRRIQSQPHLPPRDRRPALQNPARYRGSPTDQARYKRKQNKNLKLFWEGGERVCSVSPAACSGQHRLDALESPSECAPRAAAPGGQGGWGKDQALFAVQGLGRLVQGDSPAGSAQRDPGAATPPGQGLTAPQRPAPSPLPCLPDSGRPEVKEEATGRSGPAASAGEVPAAPEQGRDLPRSFPAKEPTCHPPGYSLLPEPGHPLLSSLLAAAAALGRPAAPPSRAPAAGEAGWG